MERVIMALALPVLMLEALIMAVIPAMVLSLARATTAMAMVVRPARARPTAAPTVADRKATRATPAGAEVMVGAVETETEVSDEHL